MRSLRIAFLSALVLELHRDAVGGAGRRPDRGPAALRAARPGDRAARADPRAGGVPAAARGRGPVPRQHGGGRGRRAGLRRAGAARAGVPPGPAGVPPPCPRGRSSCGSTTCASPIPSAPSRRWTGSTWRCRRAGRCCSPGTSGAGKTTLLAVLLRFADADARADHGRTAADLRDLPVDAVAPVGSRGCRSGRTCSTRAWPTTSGSACPTPTTRPSRGRSRSPRPRTSSPRCPTGTPPCSASAAPGCRRASGSGSRWRGRSCAGWTAPRWCCSTSRPRTWTRTTRRPSARASARLLDGATGIVVAHDAGWADLADEVVRLEAGRAVRVRRCRRAAAR